MSKATKVLIPFNLLMAFMALYGLSNQIAREIILKNRIVTTTQHKKVPIIDVRFASKHQFLFSCPRSGSHTLSDVHTSSKHYAMLISMYFSAFWKFTYIYVVVRCPISVQFLSTFFLIHNCRGMF